MPAPATKINPVNQYIIEERVRYQTDRELSCSFTRSTLAQLKKMCRG
jgi:hypothetical protein